MSKRWLFILSISVAALFAFAVLGGACKSTKKKSPEPTATTAAAATATESIGQTPPLVSGTPQANGENTVNVALAEYSITPDVFPTAPGTVTLKAKNIGANEHELLIVKRAPEFGSGLSVNIDGSVDEAQAGLTVVGRTEKLAAGGEASKTITLEPGLYLLICNLVTKNVSYYQKGMFVSFTVRQ